jgi:hypothetical protein
MEINQGKTRLPSQEEIKKWLANDVTKYLLVSLVEKINELDTVRNLTAENHIDKLAERKAIEVIEMAFVDLYKELPELQNKVARNEFNIVRSLTDFKTTDY